MEVYMKTFSGNVASQVCSQNHLVGRDEDRNNKPQFKSCAYIKRLQTLIFHYITKHSQMMHSLHVIIITLGNIGISCNTGVK